MGIHDLTERDCRRRAELGAQLQADLHRYRSEVESVRQHQAQSTLGGQFALLQLLFFAEELQGK